MWRIRDKSTETTLQNWEHVLQIVLISKEKRKNIVCYIHLLYTGHVPLQIPSQRSPECQKVKIIFKELPPNMEGLALDTNNTIT